MKIIDKKGKLFGIINIIDLMVLIIAILLVVGGAKRLKSQPAISEDNVNVRLTFEIPEVRMATVENVVKGDTLEHYDRGELVGEIIEVDYEPFTRPIEGEGEWIQAEVPDKYNTKVVVEAKGNDSPDVLTVGGEQMRVGTQYRMKNKRIAFFGTLMNIEVLD